MADQATDALLSDWGFNGLIEITFLLTNLKFLTYSVSSQLKLSVSVRKCQNIGRLKIVASCSAALIAHAVITCAKFFAMEIACIPIYAVYTCVHERSCKMGTVLALIHKLQNYPTILLVFIYLYRDSEVVVHLFRVSSPNYTPLYNPFVVNNPH